jgi:hypothetical protein
VLGTGERLLGDQDDNIPLRLINTRAVGDNLVSLTYQEKETSRPEPPERRSVKRQSAVLQSLARPDRCRLSIDGFRYPANVAKVQ